MKTSERYEARKTGKDWRIVDTKTGEVVLGFNSRRGYPASSLELRALSATDRLNRKEGKN